MADEVPVVVDDVPVNPGIAANAGFPRGALATPRHALLAAPTFRPLIAAPAEFAVVPKQLSYWLNNVTGICVTTEEAYAKAVWSIMCGLPETFIPDAEVGRWAQKYGFYNGAYLTEVMDVMQRDGFGVGGNNFKDGPYVGVDYSNESILQAAIATGPVKIGIDADALPATNGRNGWWTLRQDSYGNENHCVGLSGYGSARFLFEKLELPLPPGILHTTPGYLLFTWNSIGFVTHGWLMGTCQEAWLRNPTTPSQSPNPPTPPVPPVPPVPPSPPTPPAPHSTLSGPMQFYLWPFGTVNGMVGPLAQSDSTMSRDSMTLNPWTILLDLNAILAAVRAKDIPGAIVCIKKLLADLGINLPFAPLQVGSATTDIWVILRDISALLKAVADKNLIAGITALRQLLADLGITLPF